MNTSGDSSGATPSAGQIVGGGQYSLHVPLNDSGLLWLGQDEEQQRLAVMRFLPAEFRQDARAVESLKTRVQAAVGVEHENVCRTLAWYDAAGVEPFIAAEYVEGKSLVKALNIGAGQGIPWEKLQPFAASVACGLEALHRADVVHHGIRPENIFVAADTRVKLLNVVISGTLDHPLCVPDALQQPLKLRCFSPQQLSGQPATKADDFYSLGATLFELLTGAPVFGASSSVLQDIQSKPAPSLAESLAASKAQPVPEVVVKFITACLSKEPADRPTAFDCLLPRTEKYLSMNATPLKNPSATAGEKVVPLPDPIQTAELLGQVPGRSELELIRRARDARPRRNNTWAIAAALVVLLSIGGAWAYWNHQKQAVVEQQLTEAVLDVSRQRELVEQVARQKSAELEKEAAARKKLEAEARQAKEATRLAEARQKAEAEARARREERELLAAAAAKSGATSPTANVADVAPTKFFGPPTPAGDTNGFLTMFNGRDLTDWAGNTNYWSVREGSITALSPPDAPKERHLLTWTKGGVGDFELHFAYRFRVYRGNKSPNGGVNYRLTGTTNFSCYQYDLVTNPRDNGSVNDDRRRNRLAGFGDCVTATSSNKHDVVASLGDTNKLSNVKPEDWNKCVIIAKGDRVTHYLNGELVADVTDTSKSKRHLTGAIALELYTRNTNNCATFLQFNDLKLKRLGPEPKQGPGLASTAK